MSQQTQYQCILVATLLVVGVLGYFHVLDTTITTALIPSIITAIVTLPVKLNSEVGSGLSLRQVPQAQVPQMQVPQVQLQTPVSKAEPSAIILPVPSTPFVPKQASALRPVAPVAPVEHVQQRQEQEQQEGQGHSLM